MVFGIGVIIGTGIFVLTGQAAAGYAGPAIAIGTLAAFVLVSVGVLVLRRTQPDLRRAFRTPGVPAIPIVSALLSFLVMLFLPLDTWLRFLLWMGIGLAVYFLYGRTHSRLARSESGEEASREG